jgi:membrane protease YdiL (CAAX protease family)
MLKDFSKMLKNKPYGEWPWGPVAAIVVSVVAFLVAQLVVGGVFGIILSLSGWSYQRITDWFDTTTGQFLLVLISETLTLAILWWFIRRRKANVRILGFLRTPAVKDVLLGVIGFVIYFALLIAASGIAQAVFHIDLDQKQELGFDHIFSVREKLLAFVSLVILPPLVEETIFRGFLFTGLRKKLTFLWAMLFTSLLFAGPHLLESSKGPLWIAGLDTFIMSIVLCYLREKTGNLYSSMTVHFLKNGLAYSVLYIFVTK